MFNFLEQGLLFDLLKNPANFLNDPPKQIYNPDDEDFRNDEYFDEMDGGIKTEQKQNGEKL